MGRPTPEGAHRDGVDFVAVILVERQAVRGGETRVFEADGPHGVRFTLERPWSTMLLDDLKVIHESTPIQPDGDAPHRDTLVLTYRRGGFQDPEPGGPEHSCHEPQPLPTPARRAHPDTSPCVEVQLHLHTWGQPETATPERPLLVLLHGWMDVGASFQFLVDALQAAGDGPRAIVAPDWRGFGCTRTTATDAYWFPDYLGDLDALLDRLSPEAPVDLLGHSMGGNVAMSYAGVRPTRVRRLVNVEGFGLPATPPEQAPTRLAQWLDQLKRP